MSLRTVKTKMGVTMETFEPTVFVTVMRENVPILTKTFTLELVEDYQGISDNEGYQIKHINKLLEDIGELPLSDEEIFYYILTKEYA